MSTAPYLSDTPVLMETTLAQLVEVVAVRADLSRLIDLDVETISLVWDEGQAPRVTLALTARVPPDQATLDLLDPRSPLRVRVRAGYLRPDGIEDLHVVADLRVTERVVGRPANAMTLTAASDERLVIEAAPSGVVSPAQSTVAVAVRELLAYSLGSEPAFVASGRASISGPFAPIVVAPDGDLWASIDDACDQAGADVYDDGLRQWHVIDRPVLTAPSLTLTVGRRGTLTDSASALTRDAWHNAVQLVYRWSETMTGLDDEPYEVTHSIIGRAAVTSGPLASAPGNRRVYRETREIETTQAAADAAAASILRRRLADGRSVGVSAISAWWVRPGMTVSITLPTGSPVLALVVRVTFDHPAARMTLTVRQPDDVNLITPGE